MIKMFLVLIDLTIIVWLCYRIFSSSTREEKIQATKIFLKLFACIGVSCLVLFTFVQLF